MDGNNGTRNNERENRWEIMMRVKFQFRCFETKNEAFNMDLVKMITAGYGAKLRIEFVKILSCSRVVIRGGCSYFLFSRKIEKNLDVDNKGENRWENI